MDTITERLALLTLDNKNRTLSEDTDLRLGYGLCAALMVDLLLAGALREDEEGLHPNPGTRCEASYLQAAFDAIPSYTSLDRQTVLLAFYDILPRLKTLVLDALVERGVLRADTEKLKWSFALKSYVLRTEHSGYRDKVIQALLQQKIMLRDFWVVQLAFASRLLWAEEGTQKKRLQATMTQMRHLQGIGGGLDGLLAQLEEVLPDTIAASHKLPPLGKKSDHPTTWEWRGFWAEKGATLIQSSEIYKQALENISFSEMTDYYLVVEGMAENIKWRKQALEVKRPQESLKGYTAFSPKQTYALPMSPKKTVKLFPNLPPPESEVGDVEALSRYLSENSIRNHLMEVRKKRFQVKLQSQVKVEFCTLQVVGRKYLSVCVEGPDFDITAAHSHNFQSGDVMAMGYVEFLKHCQMEMAT